MKSKSDDMQDIFSKLSEKNKDILILLAKGIEIAQDERERDNETLRKACN